MADGEEEEEEEEEKEIVVQKKFIQWEVGLGIGRRIREEVINWILDVRFLYLPASVSCFKHLIFFVVIGHASPIARLSIIGDFAGVRFLCFVS